MRKTPAINTLYYGDNLRILRDYIEDESVDLVYLDPPFNSSATYNVLFKSPRGEGSQAQIEAFEDTWHWNASAEEAFDEVMKSGNSDAAEMLRAMRSFLKENDMMAYLTMMAVRLLELHRVLKPTGSLYLHCDPTASHYLKILLDAVFGPTRFLNEIVWKRTSAHSSAKRYGGCSEIHCRLARATQGNSRHADKSWNTRRDKSALALLAPGRLSGISPSDCRATIFRFKASGRRKISLSTQSFAARRGRISRAQEPATARARTKRDKNPGYRGW
ncbi:MAG: DNA methyltransferase [Xanthobacteraceae bacterium]